MSTVDPTTAAKLRRLAGCPTRYELVMESHMDLDGPRYLVQYTIRRSRTALMVAMSKVGKHIIRIAGSEKYDILAGEGPSKGEFKAMVGEFAGPIWSIHWSGRTQREAIQSADGELKFVGDEE